MAVRPTSKRPGHTCPDIDAAIRECKEAGRDAERAARRSDEEFAIGALEDASRSFDVAIDRFEDLRASNRDLRENAEEWESYAEELEAELASVEKELSRAKDELASV